MGNIITVISGKGGTGKSVISVNIAFSIATRGNRTCLIDMNPGFRTLDLYMGAEQKSIFDINDVLSGVCNIDDALVRMGYSETLFLMPAYQGDKCEVLIDNSFQELISKLSEKFDYIIMDCGPGMDEVTKLCIDNTDAAVFVITPDYISLRDADRIEDTIIRQGIMNRGYILNRVDSEYIDTGCAPSPDEITDMMRCDMLGIVSEDANIRASTNAGLPIALKRDSYISHNFDRITERIIRKFEESDISIYTI